MFPVHTGSVSLLLPPPSWPYSHIPLQSLSSSVDSILISPSQYITKCFHWPPSYVSFYLPVHLPLLILSPPDLPSPCHSDPTGLAAVLVWLFLWPSAENLCNAGQSLKSGPDGGLLSFTLAPVQLITSVYLHRVEKKKTWYN